MCDPLPAIPLDQRPDAELIAHARDGSHAAFEQLWRRHARVARACARSHTTTFDPDDLVQESFTRIYAIIAAGGGPSSAFRPYLLTTIRHLAIEWGRRHAAVETDAIETLTDATTAEDAVQARFDADAAASVFYSLPTRWQEVLWYTEIEKLRPREAAPHLGLTPNATAALAYRARAGLRRAYQDSYGLE